MNNDTYKIVLFTLWENRDILQSVLDDPDNQLTEFSKGWLEMLRDSNAAGLGWWMGYMRQDEIPQDDLYEED